MPAHVAARFMLASEPFHGIRDIDELRFVLSGYDTGTEWPPRSGISFTAGLAPEAWAAGFRMAALAEGLMQAMVDELPAKYEGPIEFPMKTVAQSARHALLRVASGAEPDDVMSVTSLRNIVANCGHKMLMAVVTANATRRRPAASRT